MYKLVSISISIILVLPQAIISYQHHKECFLGSKWVYITFQLQSKCFRIYYYILYHNRLLVLAVIKNQLVVVHRINSGVKLIAASKNKELIFDAPMTGKMKI